MKHILTTLALFAITPAVVTLSSLYAACGNQLKSFSTRGQMPACIRPTFSLDS
jgi:hypothetical protein